MRLERFLYMLGWKLRLRMPFEMQLLRFGGEVFSKRKGLEVEGRRLWGAKRMIGWTAAAETCKW
jgi:hypothetical protein